MRPEGRARAYAEQGHDRMRADLETGFYSRLIPMLLEQAGGGHVLDLGCGDGLAASLAGPGLRSYTGVDMLPRRAGVRGELVVHDLRDGLGPVGNQPYDLYLATFGVASHMAPGQLRRLIREISGHARPGSLVALEALGLHSLEWPRLWGAAPGSERMIRYRLGAEVPVHPWDPAELAAMYADSGIRPLRALDRTVQAGPKTGDSGYWPGLPPMRRAMNDLLAGTPAAEALMRPLPPLPAGAAAAIHHALAARRRLLARHHRGAPAGLARAVWALEPGSGDGLGHGLLVVGRVT